MNTKFVVLLGFSAILLNGCGAVSSTPPPPPPIGVTFGQAPPPSIGMGAAAVSISATVTNDAANGGVNWSCMPANACGTFAPTSTTSGQVTSYTPPMAVPAGGKVTIGAASVSDGTKTASAQVHITGISVTFQTAPPVLIAQGAPVNVAATVSNDAANAGVSWSCSPSPCGSFNPSMTVSGAATSYSPPGNGATVTIAAASVTDPLSTVSSGPVVVPGIASNATLKGQYAFLIRANVGNQSTRGNTTFAGSVNLDGNGNLIQIGTCPVLGGQVPCAGMEDIVSTLYYDQADPILPTATDARSAYKVDSNGHGTMSVETYNKETLTFSFVLTSDSHGEIIETGGDPGNGSLDLQSAPFSLSQISGAYAYTLNGVDSAVPPTHKLAFGGVFTANGGSITSGTLDLNDNGAFSTEAFTGNIISGPDANGRGELSMVPIGQATRTFIYYMLSPKVLRFFESDNIDLMGGSAYAQAAASSTLSGSFVFEHSGWSSAGRTVTTGQLTANGTSTITGGTSDANTGGAAPTTATTTVPVSGTFAIASNSGTLTLADAAGSSAFHVYMVDAAVNILDPNKASGGGGALLLHTDPNVIGSGVMLPQNISGPARITGVQALNLENAIASSSQREVALTGVFFSDDVSKFTNGFSDYDADDAANPSSTVMLLVPFTGTYSADASFPGHFTCAFNIPAPSGGYPFIIPSTNTFSVSIYQASGAQALVIQTDTNANSSGRIIQQTLP